MARVMITCPRTGRPAFTGIEADPEGVNQIPAINARLLCPCCGRTHTWSILDAELASGEVDGQEELPLAWNAKLKSLRDKR
jgi:hypothetical protein